MIYWKKNRVDLHIVKGGVSLKITIEDARDGEEDQIIIRCRTLDDNILRLINNLKSRGETLTGYYENKIHRVNPKDVYYFEAVDNKVFMYGKSSVYELKQKLYEIEERYRESEYFRASKSVIVNLTKIKYLNPAYGGRFEACLDNGEKIVISRQYVPDLKRKLKL